MRRDFIAKYKNTLTYKIGSWFSLVGCGSPLENRTNSRNTMKLILASLLVASASAFPTFEEFVAKFGRKYTRGEYARRAALFAKNVAAYKEHNEAKVG